MSKINHCLGRAVDQVVGARFPDLSALGSSPGKVMWNLRWAKLYWGMFSPITTDFENEWIKNFNILNF
jgi:hypothetical protein